MTNIKCSQCGYFSNGTGKKQCTRYCIPMKSDSVCVDSDEIDENVEYQIAIHAAVVQAASKYSIV